MLNRKISIFAILMCISFTGIAGNSVWKKSNQLSAKGEYEQASAIIKPIALSNNEYAVLRYAYLKYLQGEYGDAINNYEKAIKINPNSIDAKLGITLPLLAQKRWRSVKTYTLQVLKSSHWNYTAHVRLMMAEEGMRKWSTLKNHALDLIESYPSDATAFVYLARANAWQGDVSAASDAYKKVLMRQPNHAEANAYLKKNH